MDKINNSILTQLFALAVLDAGGEIRFPSDKVKEVLFAENDGVLFIDFDKETRDIIVRATRYPKEVTS